jgi:hypothetical protein
MQTTSKQSLPIEFVDISGYKWHNAEMFIVWLFNGRCVVCKKSGSEINEIVPRSRSRQSIKDWRNRVLMCHECHVEYHKNGVSIDRMLDLRDIRKKFLISVGKVDYI